jgi:hypothetical protein
VEFDNPFNQFAASFANAFRSKNVRSIVIEGPLLWKLSAI